METILHRSVNASGARIKDWDNASGARIQCKRRKNEVLDSNVLKRCDRPSNVILYDVRWWKLIKGMIDKIFYYSYILVWRMTGT